MQLNFKVFGKGEPIIILHGMFGTLDNWQTIAKQLAEQYMVFIVDLRNHGRSPHSDDFDYNIMVADLKAFMEDNWIYEARLVGHSMGGKVAMQFAAENPDMVEQLVVVDIAPKAYSGTHKTIFEALFALNLETLSSRKEADEFFETRIESYSLRQLILKNLSLDKVTKKYRWKMNLPIIHQAYPHILGESKLSDSFEKPTLFIKGANSQYILTEEFDRYKKYFPLAQLATIKNAGHWVHADQAEDFLTVLNNFLLN